MNDEYQYEYDYETDNYGQPGPTEEEWRAEIEKDLLLGLGRANIKDNKNIKNDKNTKDLKTFKDITQMSDNQELVCFAPLASASQKTPEGFVAQGEGVSVIAEKATPWSHLKIDLFDNASIKETVKGERKFKLKLGFVFADRPNQSLSAGLNHEWRFVKRGFDFSDSDDLAHYNLLEELYRTAKEEYTDVRASKCYDNIRGQKGRSIIGISVIVCANETVGEYFVILINGTDVYDMTLSNKNLSISQQKNNCIASGSMGTATTLPKMKARDFFNRGLN
jgi:hypothetical protein